MFRLLLLPLLALPILAAQSLPYRHVALRQQTADSVTVVVSWSASNADSVRVQWPGVTRTRGSRGRDSVRVARPSVATSFSLTLTPLRGSVSGTVRTLSIALPVRPQPAPSIDSAAVDTATTAAPVVTPPPVTGPVATPTAFTPNLPAGMVFVSDNDFSTDATPGLEVINWSGVTTQSATTFGVARVTTDGVTALRAWFPERHAGEGVGPLTAITPELNVRAVYMAVRMRYSANYELHTNTEKLFYPITANPQSGMSLVNVHRGGELVGKLTPFEQSAPLDGLTPPGVIPVGVWFTAEFYVRLNTPGRSDGVWQVWVNGRPVFSRTAHQFFRDVVTQPVIGRGRLDFTRGGGNSAVLTPLGGQWVDVDRLAFYAGN